MLHYLEVPLSLPCRERLAEAATRSAELLKRHEFWEMEAGPKEVRLRPGVIVVEPQPLLTAAGEALAIDIGLLMVECLFEERPGLLRWETVRRPKSDVSYNRPVVAAVGPVALDPVLVSTNVALRIIRGKSWQEWPEVLEKWLELFDKSARSQ